MYLSDFTPGQLVLIAIVAIVLLFSFMNGRGGGKGQGGSLGGTTSGGTNAGGGGA